MKKKCCQEEKQMPQGHDGELQQTTDNPRILIQK